MKTHLQKTPQTFTRSRPPRKETLMPAGKDTEPRSKRRLATDVPKELLEEVRDLVAYLQRHGKEGDPDTMTALVQVFVEDGVSKVKAAYGLDSVPKRTRALRQGRSIK